MFFVLRHRIDRWGLMMHEIDYAGWKLSDALKLHRQGTWGAPGSGAGENKREAEASRKFNTPPKHQSPPKLTQLLFALSKLAHRQSLKRSLVGVGGLEVRGRQCLALTSACYLMVARSKAYSTPPKQSRSPKRLQKASVRSYSCRSSSVLNVSPFVLSSKDFFSLIIRS